MRIKKGTTSKNQESEVQRCTDNPKLKKYMIQPRNLQEQEEEEEEDEDT